MKIEYSKQVIKFLNKYDTATRLRITKAIENLPLGDVKKLSGLPYYRLRVGDYRIIFLNNSNVMIEVVKIDSRGDVYKKQEDL